MTGQQVNPRPPALVDGPIYLDYNATTPVDPRVVAAMVPHLQTNFGNPSTTHHYGERPRGTRQVLERTSGPRYSQSVPMTVTGPRT